MTDNPRLDAAVAEYQLVSREVDSLAMEHALDAADAVDPPLSKVLDDPGYPNAWWCTLIRNTFSDPEKGKAGCATHIDNDDCGMWVLVGGDDD